MECKESGSAYGQWERNVLIETLWNVKISVLFCSICCTCVLIETLWNVKIKERAGEDYQKFSINRNIVECKDCTISEANVFELGINRNIVECKAANTGDSSPVPPGINRNIVECKDLHE